MKIPPKNIEGFVKKPSPEAAAILVYGPDEGLVRERMDALAKTVVSDLRDPFNVAEFSAAQLLDNPSRLQDEAQSISMLGGRRVVRVHDGNNDIAPIVESALEALKPGDNLVLIAAGELGPSAKLRTLFERVPNAAALPCYVDDARDIGKVITDALRASGVSASVEAVTYMAANVVGDRGVARSEVEKLVTYIGTGAKSATLDDVIACVGNSAVLPLDDLAKNVVSGKFAESERILNHVLSEGLPAVTVLRTLQNHFLKLHLAKSRLQQGASLEAALAKIRPPLFFKVKPAFEAQLMNWTLPQMEQALALLSSVEARCKQTANDPATLCSRAILSLSQMGARAFGARRRA